jgi:hypothetical protein
MHQLSSSNKVIAVGQSLPVDLYVSTSRAARRGVFVVAATFLLQEAPSAIAAQPRALR